MSCTTPCAFVLPVAATLVLAAGCATTVPGSAEADPVAVADIRDAAAVAWVDRVCGSLLPFVQATGDPPRPAEAPDPESLARTITSYLGAAEDAAETAIEGMESAGPAPVPSGDEVVERLGGSLENFRATFEDARTRIERVDLSDRQAVLTEIPAAVESLREVTTMPNPMAGFQGSPELERASREAAGCQQISREFGR